MWMFAGTVGQVVIQVIVLAVLARRLSPDDFGVAAAALVVVGLSLIFADLGVGPAIVQRKDLRRDHIRVALTVSSLLGLIGWFVLIAIAPTIAELFRIPRLTPVLRVIGAVFFVRSLSVGDHLLQRRLDFRRLSVVELSSMIFGYGIVSIVLAVTGAGMWAIIWAHVSYACLRTVLLWFVCPHPWLPSLARRPLAELAHFGVPLAVAQVASAVATQGDNFVVGRWLGPYALGLYGRAYQLMAMPSVLFGYVANQVLFPAMAAVQDDQMRLRRAYTTGVAVIALLTLPLSVVLAIGAREVILVVLGSEWLPLRSAFNVLAFCMLFRTSYKISDCLTLATGAIYRRAARQWAYAALVVLGSFIGQRWGIFGVAIGLGIALGLNFLVMAQLSLNILEMSWRAFVGAHWPAVSISCLTAAVAWPVATVLRAAEAPAALVLAGTLCAASLIVLAAIRAAPSIAGMRAVAKLVEEIYVLIRWDPARSLIDRVTGRRRVSQEGGARR